MQCLTSSSLPFCIVGKLPLLNHSPSVFSICSHQILFVYWVNSLCITIKSLSAFSVDILHSFLFNGYIHFGSPLFLSLLDQLSSPPVCVCFIFLLDYSIRGGSVLTVMCRMGKLLGNDFKNHHNHIITTPSQLPHYSPNGPYISIVNIINQYYDIYLENETQNVSKLWMGQIKITWSTSNQIGRYYLFF